MITAAVVLAAAVIAVAVLVEHMGHGGSAAAPLAKEIIEAFARLSSQAPALMAKAEPVTAAPIVEVVSR